MKSILPFLKHGLVTIMFVFAVSSCEKEDDEAITADDAADVVAYSLESTSNGLAEQTTEVAAYKTSSATLTCGVALDTTIKRSHSGVVVATAEHVFVYLLNCDASDNPVSLQASGTYSGSYDAPRTQASHSGGRNWIVTEDGDDYIFSGNYNHTGTFTSKVRNRNTFTSLIETSSANLRVDGTTGRIYGGTATVEITCTVSNGNNYDFEGTVVFNGDNTATLTINGNVYQIVLY